MLLRLSVHSSQDNQKLIRRAEHKKDIHSVVPYHTTDTNTYIGTDADTDINSAIHQANGWAEPVHRYYRRQKIDRREDVNIEHDTNINSEITVDNNSSSN